MKHAGCILAFTRQRNKELMHAFRHALSKCSFIDIPEVSKIMVNTPCSRFWVSEERAFIVVSDLLKGRPVLETMRPMKREMFQEIFDRVVLLQKQMPDASLSVLVFEVVNSPAPKFYLEPASAMEYIYKMKKNRFTTH